MKTYRFVFLFAMLSMLSMTTHAADVTTVVNAQISVNGQDLSPRYASAVYRNLKVVAYVDGKECGRQEECKFFYTAQQTRIIFFPVSIVTSEANNGKTIEMHLIVTAPDDGSNDYGIWYDSEFAEVSDGEYIIQDVVLPQGESGLTIKDGSYGYVGDESMSFVTLDFVPSSPSFPDEISINVGEEKDLLSLIYYLPDNGDFSFNDKVSIPYNPTIEWDFGNSAEYINVENNILKGLAETETWGAYLGGRYTDFPDFSIYSIVKVTDPDACKVYASLFVDGKKLESYDEYDYYGLSAYVNGQRVAGPVSSQAISPAGGPGFLLKMKDASGNIEFRVSKRDPFKKVDDIFSTSEYIIRSARLLDGWGNDSITTFPFKGGVTYGSMLNPVQIELVTPTQVGVSPTQITAVVGQPVSFANTFTVSFLSSNSSPASIPSSYDVSWNVGNYVDIFSTEGDLLTANQYSEDYLTVSALIQNEELSLSLETPVSVRIASQLRNLFFEESYQVVNRGGNIDISYYPYPRTAAKPEVKWVYDETAFEFVNDPTGAPTMKVKETAAYKDYEIVAIALDEKGEETNIKATLDVTVCAPVSEIRSSVTGIMMKIGESLSLSQYITILPEEACDKGFFVDVDKLGREVLCEVGEDENANPLFEACGLGTATLTIYPIGNKELKTHISVTVATPLTSIAFAEPTQSLRRGGMVNTTITPTPENASGYEITYSYNQNVFEQKSADTGLSVKENAPYGDYEIVASAKDAYGNDLGITAKLLVNICATVSEIRVVSPITMSLNTERILSELITVLPEEACEKGYRVVSSNDKVATIAMDNNKERVVKAVGYGSATLTVTSTDPQLANNPLTAKIEVTVADVLTGIAFVEPNQTVYPGAILNTAWTYSPENAVEPLVKFEYDSNVFEEEKSPAGAPTIKVKEGAAAGTYKIEAQAYNGDVKLDNITATLIVTVWAHVTDIQVTSPLTMTVGDEIDLSPYIIVLPENAHEKGYAVRSGNSDIVRVDRYENKEGYFATAVAEGNATLTVISMDNQSIQKEIVVNVKAKVIPVTGIAMAEGYKNKTLWAGETLSLTPSMYVISPNNATNKQVEWKSSDENVLKINRDATNNGLIAEALKPGNATLTVTTVDGGKSAEMSVEVRRHVESFSLTSSSLTMDKGSTLQLDGLVKEVLPLDASDRRIGWSTAKGETGLTVKEADGKWYVTANAVGQYALTAYSVENPQLTQRLSVTVNAVVGGITVNSPVQSVYPGGSIDLGYKVDSSDEVSVEWTSSDAGVVSVTRGNDGKWVASALKPGIATLTVKTVPGSKTATITVTVWSHVSGLTLTSQTLTLEKGSSAVLDGYVKVAPEDAHDKSVRWTSSDKLVATVSESNGVWSVTAVGGGECELKVTSVDNAQASASMSLKVTVSVTGITIEDQYVSQTLWLGDSPLRLTSDMYTITPSDASDVSVTWKSADESVVSVSQSATDASWSATPKKVGKTTLTVTTSSGGKSAEMSVEVRRHVESFSLTSSSLTLDKGSTLQLDGLVKEVLPSDASDKRIGWSTAQGETGLTLSESDGKWSVTANTPGNYTLTAYSIENPQLTQSLSVMVNAEVSDITVMSPVQSVYPGGVIDLGYKINAEGDVSVEWTSSAPTVVSVTRGNDGKWVAKALKPGSATLTVKTVPGGKTATISVTVWSHVESVALTEQSLSLTKGQSAVLDGYVKVSPEDAHDKSVRWTTSDKSVATVSESNGVWSVSAAGAGDAVLTVTSVDNSQASASLKVNVTVSVTGITIKDKYSSQTLWIGDTPLVLTPDMYTITPSDASEVSVKWSSADASIVSVSRSESNASWTATPKKVGKTTLTVTTVDGGKSAVMSVEVRRHVESFSLTLSSLTMDKGSTHQLDGLVKEVLPTDASDRRIGWSTAKGETGLTVKEADGKWYVTANAVGQYTLTAYSVENPQLTQHLSVTVNAVVGGITVNSPVQSVYPGGSIDLGYKVDSSDEVSVEWTSSDAGVVSVTRGNDGKWVASALKPGSATLTVKTVPGSKTATIAVTVWSHVSGLTLTSQTLTLEKGGSAVLDGYVKVAPEDAHDKSLRWTSSDKSVATVSESNGVWSVAAVGGGECELKVTSVDNAQASATLTLKVTVSLKNLAFTNPEQTAYAGDDINVTWTATPADANNFEVKLEYDHSVFTNAMGGTMNVNAQAAAGTYIIKAIAYSLDGKELGVTADMKVTVKKHVLQIEVTLSGALAMTAGERISLSEYIKVTPTDATDKGYTVRSENESIVKVTMDANGGYVAEAVSAGETTLIISSNENPNIQAMIPVKVDAALIKLESLAFNKPEQAVYAGESVDVTWKATPANAESYSVKLEYDSNVFTPSPTSSNVLTVNPQAVAGDYTITAKAYDLQGKELGITASMKVTVWTHVEGLTLTEQILVLNKGMTTVVDRYVQFTPANAHEKSLRWTSSNESVAVLSENNGFWSVTALSKGEATLIVTSVDNPQATATMLVKVVVPLEGVVAVNPNQTVEVGSNIDLSCTFTPTDASDLSMTWTSSDDAVVEVSFAEDGSSLAVAKGFGTATLMGRTNDGGYTTTITVTVSYHVTEIKLTTSSISLKPSQTFNPDTYVQAVLPEQAPDKSLTWESSDANIVKLEGQSGAYIATTVGAGEASLTVRSNDSPNVTATLKVMVTEDVIPLTGLMFNYPTQTVFDGETVDVTWTPAPNNANSYSVKLEYDEEVFEYKSNVMRVRSGVAAGEYTIVAQAYNADNKEMKVSATLTVTVRTHVSGLTLSDKLGDEPLSVAKDESVVLDDYVIVTPADAYNKNVEWTSSDVSVATVSVKDGVWIVTGVSVGETTLIVKSMDNPDISASLKVQVVEGLSGFSFVKTIDMTKEGEAKTIDITPIPKTASVDVNKFSITVDDIYGQGKDWKYLDVAVKEQGGRIEAVVSAAYTWGVNAFHVFYDGKEVGCVSVNVGAVMPFEKGWNWITTPYADYMSSKLDEIDLDDMGAVFGKDLQEIRATDVLLYKDPIMGYFGDFTGLSSAKMYQFDFEQKPEAFVIYNINRNKESANVSSGWNWLAYPYEYAYTLTELTATKAFASASEGDRIVVQDEFAEFVDGKWIGTLATLQPSEGFMYYRKVETDAIVDWAGYDALGQKLSAPSVRLANGRRAETKVWNYDARVFADNMTIVATIEAVDFPENCTVGAFVGGECRGQGEYVDGRYFITVHGMTGESVSFVLYDEQMQIYRTVFGNLSFGDKAGSVKTPLRLKAGGQVTAIDDLQIENEKSFGSLFYDLQGRPVEAPVKGLYIINGEKRNIK